MHSKGQSNNFTFNGCNFCFHLNCLLTSKKLLSRKKSHYRVEHCITVRVVIFDPSLPETKPSSSNQPFSISAPHSRDNHQSAEDRINLDISICRYFQKRSLCKRSFNLFLCPGCNSQAVVFLSHSVQGTLRLVDVIVWLLINWV